MEPPASYSPAFPAMLLDGEHKSCIRVICAVLFDLTGRGFLKWELIEVDERLDSDLDRDYQLTVQYTFDSLPTFEKIVLDRVKGSAKLSDLLPPMRDIFEEEFTIEVRNEAEKMGLYNWPKGVRGNIINPILAFSFIMVAFFTLAYASRDIGSNWWSLGGLLIVWAGWGRINAAYGLVNKAIVADILTEEGMGERARWLDYQSQLPRGEAQLDDAIASGDLSTIKYSLALDRESDLYGDFLQFIFCK